MIGRILNATRFALLIFRRNPASTFFTIVFPVIFLVLFGSLFGNEIDDETGLRIATFQVPGILALALVSATFVNLAMTSVFRREQGQLKRLRGTPMPPVAYVLGQVLAAIAIASCMTVLVVAIGRIAFDVEIIWSRVGALAITVALGSTAFSALGLAVTRIIPNADAAPAVTNAIVLPLYFISGVFLQADEGPEFLQRLGDIFPVKPLTLSLHHAFIEFEDVPWDKWLVVAIWGVVGVALAARTFRWLPQYDRG